MTTDILRILVPAALAFLIGVGITPFVTHFLYKHQMWKRRAGKVALDGTVAEEFNRLHNTREVGTPRFGGIIVWASVMLCADLLSILARIYPAAFAGLAFISRGQTWVPLAAFAVGALFGFVDDLFEVVMQQGLRLRVRLLIVGATLLLVGMWFYDKLDVHTVTMPFVHGPVELGALFVPFFILVGLFMYAGGVIDGIDGLSGGVFAIIFGAYSAIAFFQNQLDIAALAAAIAGGLLAFLWFNIPPARFYLSETGTMALTLVLTTLAFFTDTLGGGRGLTVLPVIGFLLVVTVLSNIIQIFGKKVLGRKIFRIAPLHHHFEALGWPPYKVTMRYWVVGVVAAILGIVIALF